MFHSTSPSLDRITRAERLAAARLYVCTDARTATGDLAGFLHAAYAGGVDIIQLRDKKIDTDDEIAALQVLARVAAEHDALFAVNDRADVAALVGADIFHIGQRDLTPQQARHLLGDEVLIGHSTHDDDQAAAARVDHDVDYFCTGPVWETPTKPGRPAAGLDFVARTARVARTAQQAEPPGSNDAAAGKPWFAIGGINTQTLPEVRAAGAERIVVVRAITEADDPGRAAQELRRQLPA